MADCECLPGCPFFNDKMDADKGLGQIYKKKYCLGDNTDCARHMVFKKLGREKVPANPFPNMQDRARDILSAA